MQETHQYGRQWDQLQEAVYVLRPHIAVPHRVVDIGHGDRFVHEKAAIIPDSMSGFPDPRRLR